MAEEEEMYEEGGFDFSDAWRQLYHLRKANKLTQKALADKVDLTQSAISKIEAAVAIPSYDAAGRIAHALGITHIGESGETEGDVGGLLKRLQELQLEENSFLERTELNVADDTTTVEGNIVEAAATAVGKVTVNVTGEKQTPDKEQQTVHHRLQADPGTVKVHTPSLFMRFQNKKGKSLLNMPRKTDGNKTTQQMIPRYFRESNVSVNDTQIMIAMQGMNDTTPCPPDLLDVPGAYAIEMLDGFMAPRFYAGDTLYVDTKKPPTYHDDVFIQIERNGVLAGIVTTIIRMEREVTDNGHDVFTYGCLPIHTQTLIDRECYATGVVDQIDVLDEQIYAADWFILPSEKELYNEIREQFPDLLVIKSIHVIVGSQRKRMVDRTTGFSPRLKRQLEAEEDAKRGV